MEKQIYGNITNTARTQFQFDRTYPNRTAMEAACDNDGIYAGRYVLVEYDDENLDCFTQLYKKGEKFYFAEFPSIQARPGINIDSNGKLCYVRTDKDYLKVENNIRNIGSCEFYKTTSEGFELIVKPEEEKINPYVYNWNIDYDKYTRGFDSTVWQKLYMDGKERYIMIAELNTVVPQFSISADAPTMNPLAPHVSSTSTNVDYDLHIQSPWGFRVAQARDGSLSDETTYHVQYQKDENGKLVVDENGQFIEEEPLEVQADIYYNKDALLKYDYKLVDFANHVPYEKNKYYYQRVNVYALDQTNYTLDSNFDRITFYKEKQESNPKTKYYYNSLELTTVNLLKSYETNWQPRTFYFISNQEFSIVVDAAFDENKQYYISQTSSSGNIIYTPVKIREDQYVPNKYYEARNIYMLDENDSFQKDKEYYRKNVDDTYSLVDYMTVKPEYEIGKYYKFESAAYILEDQEFPNQTEQYYKKLDDGSYVKVYFGGNEYTPYVYYKKVEDDYVLIRDEEMPQDIDLYERVIQAEINDAANQITVLPTGQSGRLYNNHLVGAEKSQEVANDIQEMSIILPALGNMAAEIWNLIYTKQRNDLIYENPFYDPNMYKEDQTPLYLSNLNSVAGIINKVHDLIGHNILGISEMESLGIIAGTNQVGIKSADGTIIKNNAWPEVSTENIGKYIFKDDYGKYYRVIVNENTGGGYTLTPAQINDGNQEMQTLYEALLNIYEVLGTGETPENASTDTLKGALFQLNAMIDEFAKGFEVLSNPDDSIEISVDITYRGLNGEVLYDPVGQYEIATTENSGINASNYKNYYVQVAGEYAHPTEDYDTSEQYYYLSHYYVFNDEDMLVRRYYYENEAKYVIKYQKYRINHKKPTATRVNVLSYNEVTTEGTVTEENYTDYWVKDETTGIYYKLTAYDPDATYYDQIVEVVDTNEVIAELIDDFAPTQLSIQKFNATGHVLNPKYATEAGVATNSNIILPQAIVSATEPVNCPVGTLWYDISDSDTTPTT